MKRALVASLLLCGLILMGGAIRPDRDPGFGDQMEIGFRGGNTEVDTFRIWSHSTTFPNTAAKTASYIYTDTTRYTTINRGTGAVRWCYVSKAAAAESVTIQASTGVNSDYLLWTRSCGNSLETDYAWNADQRLAFVWVNVNGIRSGQKIESAYLMINVAAGSNLVVAAGSYLSARLDTISTDYRITSETTSGNFSSNNDVARMNATWVKVTNTAGGTWTPSLSSRLDYGDFGPRSDTVIGPGTYTPGTCLRLNVTDAVQQASDNGTLARGLLFLITASSNTASTNYMDICAGNHPTFVATGKGCPTFTAVSTSRRGSRPWGGVRVPITFQFDDNYNVQTGYFRAMTAAGHTFVAAACSANAYARVNLDSLYQAHPGSLYFVHHTMLHESLGDMTAGQLAFNLNRTWFPTLFTGFPAADTSRIVDYAMASGGGTINHNAAVACKMIDFGYRSMRSSGYIWNTTSNGPGFAHDTPLAWSGWVNKFQIASVPSQDIFGFPGGPLTDTAEATEAQIKEELRDYIDLYYTQYGKSALVIYGHWYNPGGTANWISEANLGTLLAHIATLNSARVMSYPDVISMRLSNASAKTPAQVEVGRGATADSNQIQAAAAIQDSIYVAGGYNNLLQVWIGPK